MTTKVNHWKESFSTFWHTLSTRAEVTMAAKMGIAASLSFLIGHWFYELIEHPSTFVSGLWCVMASIVVMQSRLGGTYKAVWSRFLGILVGSVAGGLFITTMGEGAISICIGVFFTVALCSLLNLADSIRIAGLSTALIIVSAMARPGVDPWDFAFFRFIDSCIGLVVALCVSYFLWPEKATENMRKLSERILGLLGKFYQRSTTLDIKDSEVKTVPVIHLDIEEMLALNRTYCEESEMEIFDKNLPLNQWKKFIAELENLYELMVSIERVHKDAVSMIIDDDLSNAIEKVIVNSDIVLQNVEKMISTPPLKPQEHTLKNSLDVLSQELTRFRSTHATRKFNIEHVESYFVFFYSLKAIGEELLKMEHTASEL